jgi:hypothetical protein
MNPYFYYIGTSFIYVVCVIGGIFIDDLGLVFNMISAFTLSFLGFIWPSSFYLMAIYYHASVEKRK